MIECVHTIVCVASSASDIQFIWIYFGVNKQISGIYGPFVFSILLFIIIIIITLCMCASELCIRQAKCVNVYTLAIRYALAQEEQSIFVRSDFINL